MEDLIQNDVTALSRIDAVGMILKTLSELTGLPFSLVARITDDSWTACAIYDTIDFGLKPGDGLVLKTTYCNTVGEINAPLFIRHASEDPKYQHHPALQTYAVESYLGVPLYRQNGEYFGVLCALDTKPNDLSERHIETFLLMAKLIAYELEAEEQRRDLEEALKLAHLTNEARARFMGILGHDLRNPVSTIMMAARLQLGGKLDADKNTQMADKILRTSQRMQYLIEDLLDASQTAQGNQILIRKSTCDLREICESIVEEYRLANPERDIYFTAPEICSGEWDKGRLEQIMSNLLSNALSYGNAYFPISVRLTLEEGRIRLEVNNHGEPMSEETSKNLFTPFWRGARKGGAGANSSGLGLGLYIVKQIVEAHGGTIGVESNFDDGTTFTVVLPCGS